MDAYDYLFKFILIGDSAVGKSCILTSLIENKFKKGSSHTIGVEFGSKIINVSGKRVKLQIWDTAGQERYRSVTRSYYRGAAGALIVYDITNRDTYHHLINWLADARTLARADISIIAVGNKSDLKDKRAVTFLEASRCAQENGVSSMVHMTVCIPHAVLRDFVSRDECSDRRGSGGGLRQGRQNDPKQDRRWLD
mmetsp:Transcript_1553/g.4247  ORF Transcript_1553/g.4247 Transcript_1553/m.4247 type:complete len:195 (-) Transcript_1553:215-799(-)